MLTILDPRSLNLSSIYRLFYLLTEAAEHDVLDIYLYGYSAFGKKQADLYHDVLEKAFEFLSVNPHAGSPRDELKSPLSGSSLRVHPVRSHIIIYTFDETNIVSIVRVRHAHEDWL